MDRFIDERLSLFRELIESGGFRGGAPFGLESSRIRFVLSKSLREMKIPYLVARDDLDTIEKAILELMYLVKKRLEKNGPMSGDMKLSADSIGVAKTLPEKSYRMDLFSEGSIEKKLAEYVLFFIPLIDGGILYGWLGKKGKGSAMIGLLKRIYLKALEQEVRIEGKEQTAYLIHIALLNSIKGVKDRLKKVAVKGVSYERWEYSIGILLFFVMDTVVRDTINDFTKAHPLYDLRETGFLLKSTLTPWSFLSIKGVVTNIPVNPYYMTTELVKGILPLSESVTDSLKKDMDGLVKEITAKVVREEGLVEAVIRMEKIRKFRICLFDYIRRYTDSNVDVYKVLEAAFRDEKMLQNIVFDERFTKEWLKEIGGLKERFPSDEGRIAAISSIENFFRPTKKGWFSGMLKPRSDGEKQGGALIDTVRRFLSYRFDEEVEGFLAPRKTILVDMRHEFAEKKALMEYEKGRAYLISSDKRVILKDLANTKEGQLYIDMKNFTRKTFNVKEITMADFMKSHFYKPILKAAGRYAIGGRMVEDSGSIRLQNLLGDACIYSGDISSLVFLAEDIQVIMDKYRRELEVRLQSLNIGDPLERIKSNYESLKDELVKKKEILEGGLKTEEKGDAAELMETLDREEDIERAFSEEVDEAREKEIDAGLFISYGTKAETIHLEDEQWGDKDVAIGEKINEASRGVNRNRLIRVKVERLLEEARKKLRNPHLRLPFDVYIDRMYNLKIDPESVAAIDRAMIHRDVSRSEKLTKVFASKLFLDLRDTLDKGSLVSSRYLTKVRDIYNKGHALSEETLKAFIRDTGSYTQHFSKKVRVAEFHPEIRAKFFFIEDPIEFWFSIKRAGNKVIIFRKVGRLTFRGFESGGGTTVYEMLKRMSEFYRMIIKYHLAEWSSTGKMIHSPGSK
ncbi:MAG: hypothetical protein ACE5IH_07445, partial [Thermodesulfobacteriota bacterium]